MSNYVWTAIDKSGNKVVKEIEAETAIAAKAILLAEGFSDLSLKGDEISSAVGAGFRKTGVFGETIKVTAEQRLRHRDNPTVSFWDALKKGFDGSKLGWVFLFLFGICAFYQGDKTAALLVFMGLFIWVGFGVCVKLPSIYYQKLIKASDWSRWEEVLLLTERLKAFGRLGLVKLPATELTRNRVKALAGTGRLDQALAEYRQCEGRPDCPTWLYRQFVGSLYAIAKQHDKAIEFSLMSIADRPTPTAWLDLAIRYAKYKHDAAKAREALAEAEKSPIVDYAEPFRATCKGMIYYLEGDFLLARGELESAIKLVEKAEKRPYRDGQLSIARGYLCCVFAKLGDLASAKECFSLSKEYLVATDEDLLLAECRKLVGEQRMESAKF